MHTKLTNMNALEGRRHEAVASLDALRFFVVALSFLALTFFMVLLLFSLGHSSRFFIQCIKLRLQFLLTSRREKYYVEKRRRDQNKPS